jgi:translation initiation factor IF-1
MSLPKIGGKKGKTFAHKRIDKQFILPQDDESLAIVTQICGNGVFKVTTSNETLIAYLPGRMKGPNKRHNVVLLYSIVLVSIRAWETAKTHCDILHIYSNHHIQSIQNLFPDKMKIINSFNPNHQETFQDEVILHEETQQIEFDILNI